MKKNKDNNKEKKGLIGRIFGGGNKDAAEGNKEETSSNDTNTAGHEVNDTESTDSTDEQTPVDNLEQAIENRPKEKSLVKKPKNSFSAILEENRLKREASNRRVLEGAKDREAERQAFSDKLGTHGQK